MNVHADPRYLPFEMSRTWRTLFQSIATPVMTTSLYFVVFGSAIGSRMMNIDGVSYGAFIVPGLIMLTVLMESVSNGSFGIYMPKFAGTIYELLSAPVGLTRDLVSGIRGRRGHQVRDPGRRHPGDRAAVRAVLHRASVLDDPVPDAHLGHVRLLGFADRHLGRQLGEDPASCR